MNSFELIIVDNNDLWKALEVETRFNDWIKRRLEESLAVNGVDFCKFYSNLSKTS